MFKIQARNRLNKVKGPHSPREDTKVTNIGQEESTDEYVQKMQKILFLYVFNISNSAVTSPVR